MPSMIGTAFITLTFLLLNYSQRPVEADITMSLHGVYHPHGLLVTNIDPLVVSIESNGEIQWGGETVETDLTIRDLPNLAAKLKQFKAANELLGTQAYIHLDTHESAEYQRFIDVLNLLAKLEIQNIGL